MDKNGKENRIDFCTECRKETKYRLQKRDDFIKSENGSEFRFPITIAVCAECGREMHIPGLIDQNIQEMAEAYQKYFGISLKV